MPTTTEFDKLFCLYAKKYGLEKLFLKAVAITESSLDPNAYRYEPSFWDHYLKDKPEWKDQDPRIVSASWGLMQLMWTTAWGLGFRGEVEDIINPVFNIELGAKLLRQLLDRIKSNDHGRPDVLWMLNPLAIACARYNGGSRGNPDDNGNLRNADYALRVFDVWKELIKTEAECDET